MQDVIDLPTGSAIAVRPDHQAPAHRAPSSGGLLSAVERIMNDPTVSIERVNAAFDFYQRARDDQAKRDFAAALSACQAEMGPVAKDADNSQTRSKYATFAALDAALRPIYTRHGLALSFGTKESPKPDHIRVVCTLSHSSGHEREYTFDAACDGKGAKGNSVMSAIHAEGSALSYGRRYLEGGIFNIAFEDDDGNAASRRPPMRAPEPAADMVPDQPVNYDDVRITGKQIEELTGLIAETNSNIDRFLRFAKVGGLDEIKSAEFSKLKAMLLTKRSQANAPR